MATRPKAEPKGEAPTPEDLGLELQQPEPPPETGDDNTTPEPEAPKARGRGRPPGSGSKSASEKPKKTAGKKAEDVEAFAKQLQGIHFMIAMVSKMPEMQIDMQEAKMIANGINAVAEEYGLEMNGKTGAAFQLFGAAAIIYGPRAFAVNMRVKKARAQAQQEQAQQDQANTIDGSAIIFPQGGNVSPGH